MIPPVSWLFESSGAFYAAVSGWLGLISVGAVAHHLTVCHTKGCHRRGKYPVEGTPYKVCHRCHPDVPDGHATREQIRIAAMPTNTPDTIER